MNQWSKLLSVAPVSPPSLWQQSVLWIWAWGCWLTLHTPVQSKMWQHFSSYFREMELITWKWSPPVPILLPMAAHNVLWWTVLLGTGPWEWRSLVSSKAQKCHTYFMVWMFPCCQHFSSDRMRCFGDDISFNFSSGLTVPTEWKQRYLSDRWRATWSRLSPRVLSNLWCN